MRTTRTACLLGVGLAAAFVATLIPSTTVSASGARAAKDPLQPYTQQKLHWQRCDAQTPAAFRCATVRVPLDYGDPGGKTLGIAVNRLASSGKERRGVLLFNPGGPGASGLSLPADMAGDLSEGVKKRYDLIGFDPRGIGKSSPLHCGLTPDEQNFERPYSAGTFAKDVRWARTVADKCRARGGDKLPHLTTRNTARDMDIVRAALGERQISYYGGSYGTYLGAVYLQMFPRRADRFVLDSAADPARYGRGTFQQIAEGTEPAFVRWSRWTARRHATYRLGNTPAEVRETFWALVARADRAPIATEEGPLTGDGIRAMRQKFFGAEAAAGWVAGLKKSAEGDRPASPKPSTPPSPSGSGPAAQDPVSGLWAVTCADTAADWPREPGQYRRDAIRDKARYPLYGDMASHIKPCAFWKQGSEPPTTVNNRAKALILQNEWDSQTPLHSAQGMHRALRGSRMITVAGGEGHGVHGTNPCADRNTDLYLTTGRLPAEDLTCRAATG